MSEEKHCIDVSSDAVYKSEIESVENNMDQDEPSTPGWSEEIQEEEKTVIKEEFDDFVKISHIDEEEEPRMILIQGKNKEYLSAWRKVNEILRTASFHRGFKKVKTTSFKVTEFKN